MLTALSEHLVQVDEYACYLYVADSGARLLFAYCDLALRAIKGESPPR